MSWTLLRHGHTEWAGNTYTLRGPGIGQELDLSMLDNLTHPALRAEAIRQAMDDIDAMVARHPSYHTHNNIHTTPRQETY